MTFLWQYKQPFDYQANKEVVKSVQHIFNKRPFFFWLTGIIPLNIFAHVLETLYYMVVDMGCITYVTQC